MLHLQHKAVDPFTPAAITRYTHKICPFTRFTPPTNVAQDIGTDTKHHILLSPSHDSTSICSGCLDRDPRTRPTSVSRSPPARCPAMAHHQRSTRPKLPSRKDKRDHLRCNARSHEPAQRKHTVYISVSLLAVLVFVYIAIFLVYIFRTNTSNAATASDYIAMASGLFARDTLTANSTNSTMTTNAAPNRPVFFNVLDMVLLILGVVFSILGLQALAWAIWIVVWKGECLYCLDGMGAGRYIETTKSAYVPA
jgi:hypothetical protein